VVPAVTVLPFLAKAGPPNVFPKNLKYAFVKEQARTCFAQLPGQWKSASRKRYADFC